MGPGKGRSRWLGFGCGRLETWPEVQEGMLRKQVAVSADLQGMVSGQLSSAEGTGGGRCGGEELQVSQPGARNQSRERLGHEVSGTLHQWWAKVRRTGGWLWESAAWPPS